MNAVTLIALASLGISVITTVIMLMGQRHTATTDYVAGLEKRIESLEGQLETAQVRIKDLEEHNGNLMRENIELLRQIAKSK